MKHLELGERAAEKTGEEGKGNTEGSTNTFLKVNFESKL